MPEFDLLAFASATGVLHRANRALGYLAYSWRTATNLQGTVTASCGTPVLAEMSLISGRKALLNGSRPSMVVICAGDNADGHSTKGLEAWMRECRHHRVMLAALGTGTQILASSGVLSNKSCAVHWQFRPGFSERFMDVDIKTSIYTIDDSIWTCSGSSASLDMMLYLVGQQFGPSVVSQICEHALIERGRGPEEAQRVPFVKGGRLSNPTVLKLIQEMERTAGDPVPMSNLAKFVDRSRRQMERLFRREIGCSPSRYYLLLRLERAKMLLVQSDMPIIEIAVGCGFVSASHFSKCFREVNGVTPQALRRSNANENRRLLSESHGTNSKVRAFM
ncbi:MAG: GlxA family transcriptional regulator [Mesorhizobium sp.]|nr:MAG: GlxA family transcriptional regulator [Mesorhizobium sp.]RWB81225.1 MAG: GlxA family transcriptional regulator [Mesorhizobium sp.]RWF79339.1 MAG: GlxA family transcriptional regulator [Mesorhizobium sp.]TIS68790.1 MAG: GlxA family transcriptional regulator [Mesorhizobium sp.]TIW51104.1 MAG: GlxA family transcriptional regulator [Mesorhizobium sp.]